MILSKKHHIHHRTKSVLSYLMSFFIMICTVLIFMCVTLKLGLFNPSVIESSMHKGNYYEYRLKILNNGIENLLTEAGLPENLAEGVVTDSMMSIDTSSYISNTLNNKPVSYDTEMLETKFKDNVTEYLRGQGITPDEKLERYISGMASEAAAIYKSNISFEFINPYMEFSAKYNNMLKPVAIASIAVIIICAVLLLLLHARKYRAIRFCTYGLLPGCIVTVFASLYAKRTFMGLIDGDGTYYDVMRMYISSAFSQGYIIAFGGIMLCCISLLITYVFRKKAI